MILRKSSKQESGISLEKIRSSKTNSDLEIIQQEVKLVQREREIKSLKKELNNLEKDYNIFKLLKEDDCVPLSIMREVWHYPVEITYSLGLYVYKNNKVIAIHISEQIFTKEEYGGLDLLADAMPHNKNANYNLGTLKLNKGTPLYNVVMTRIDKYYITKIQTIKSELEKIQTEELVCQDIRNQ